MRQAHRILLAGAGDELRLMLDRALGALPDAQVDETASAEPHAINGKAIACDALIVEIDLRSAAATESFARLAAATPERKVIAAARNAAPEDVRRLFRAGAADVLTAPFTSAAIEAALGDILHTGDPSAAAGRVVTVIRGCGGIGATTVALNLAALAAKPDRKGKGDRRNVAVLDLDLQFGDASVALNLQPRSTMVEVLHAEQRLDGRLLLSAMVEHSSGLRLLAAPPKLVPLDALSPDFAAKILAQSAKLHDYTFVDLPCGWSDWTLPILRRSSLLVLLATPTVQGAVGAGRVLEALADAGVTTPVLLALNKLAGVVETFEKPSRIAKSLSRRIDATLSFDATAARAFERGALLTDAFPNARLTRDLRALAAKVEPAIVQAEQLQTKATGAAA